VCDRLTRLHNFKYLANEVHDARRPKLLSFRRVYKLACQPKLRDPAPVLLRSCELRRTTSLLRSAGWWSQTGSNRRPQACKASALPTELWPRSGTKQRTLLARRRLVGPGRVERPTSRLSGVRSNHLSYEPVTETEFTKSGIRRSKRARSKRGGMPKQSKARISHFAV
jgi:hypothetical protein